MPAAKRLAAASAKGGQQNRLSKEERLAMENWFTQQRAYPEGTTGRPMTNLRWINGAGSKGLKTANVDSKDATQSGAHLSLAAWVNRRLGTALAKPWTAEIANTKWKNMKTSFKRIIKEYQFPIETEWLEAGKNKEDMAEEIERITAIRKSKCASYDVLWKELHKHPSINPSGRLESSQMLEDEDEMEQDNDEDEDEDEENDQEERANKKSRSSATASEGNKSPRPGTPTRQPAAAARTSPNRKTTKPKLNKFKFKKSSHAPRHRDITQAYISMKAEWNRMWLRVQILKERREVYFICRDRGMSSNDVKLAFDDIGLGKLPAYLPSWGEDPLHESFKGPPNHDAANEMRRSDAWEGQKGDDGSGSSSSDDEDDEDDDDNDEGAESSEEN
jgi:hypothetical protein